MRWVLVVAAIAAGCVGGCGFEPTGGAPLGLAEPIDAVATTGELDATDDAVAADAEASPPDAASPDAPVDGPDASGPGEDCGNGRDDDDDGDPDCRDDDCGGCPGVTSCCASGACALVCVE